MKTPDELNNSWRKVALTIYKKPSDSKIFGSVDIDVTDLDEFIAEKRRSGIKITITHFFTLALARAYRSEVPEMNAFVRRGKIIPRGQVDAMVSVLMKDKQLGSVKVENADKISLSGVAKFLNDSIANAKVGDENKVMQNKNMLACLPWPLRNWFFALYNLLAIKWGLSIPFIRLSPNDFGSFAITNIGSLGLDMGIPALLPSTNVSMVFVLGGVQKKPVVINDKITVRKILALGAVIDHRLADASHGATLFRYLKFIVKNPQLLDQES